MIRWNGITIDRMGRRISGLRLTRHQFRIAEALICGKPKTRAEMFDFLYGHLADGGPLDPKTIDVRLCGLRKLLATIGLAIESGGSCGQGKTYWIELAALPVEQQEAA